METDAIDEEFEYFLHEQKNATKKAAQVDRRELAMNNFESSIMRYEKLTRLSRSKRIQLINNYIPTMKSPMLKVNIDVFTKKKKKMLLRQLKDQSRRPPFSRRGTNWSEGGVKENQLVKLREKLEKEISDDDDDDESEEFNPNCSP